MEVWSLVGKITMQGFDKASSQLTSLEKKIKANEKAFAGLRKAGIALVAMTAAIAGGALKAAIDFETAFAGVRKTVNATEDQFAALKQEIRDLSKTLPVTSTEIAGVAEAAGQLGIRTEDIMAFTEVMIKLGMATDLASSDAATSLARFANITKLAAEDFDNLGSTIVDLGNNMAATESEIVDMSMRIAGAGTTAGLSQQEILALSAALTSMGLRAEAGGTAISQVFLTMNSAVLSGGEELKQFAKIAGMSANDFASVYKKNASTALVEFISGLGRMNDAGGDAAGQLEELGLGGIRITDTMLRAANAQDILTDAIVIANEAWGENSALQEEVDKRNETVAAKLTILKNKAVDVAVTLGDALIPALTSLIDKISPIIDGIGKWVKENQGLTKWLLAIAGSGGALLLFVGLLPKFIGLVVGAKNAVMLLSNVTKVATGIQWLWNAALTANPIGLVILAVGALGTAVYSFYRMFKEIFKKTGDSIEEIARKAKEAAEKTAREIEARTKELTAIIKDEYDQQLKDQISSIESKRSQAEKAHDDAIEALRVQYGLEEYLAEDTALTLAQIAEEASKARAKAIDKEVDAARDAYDIKIKLLNKEEAASQKAYDKKVSDIDDLYQHQMEVLNKQTAAVLAGYNNDIDALYGQLDKEARKRTEQDREEREAELQASVDSAETEEEKIEAIAALKDYQAQVDYERWQEGLRDQIAAIQESIQNTQDEADAKAGIYETAHQQRLDDAQAELEAEKTRINLEIENEQTLLDTTLSRLETEKEYLDTALAEELERLATELKVAIYNEEVLLAEKKRILDDEVTAIKNQHAELITEEKIFQEALAQARGEILPSGPAFNPSGPLPPSMPGYAQGGVIPEPTLLTSLRTMKPYGIAGEAGAESIVPGRVGAGIQQTFNVNAIVREEADIKKIARELYNLQQRGLRSVGVV